MSVESVVLTTADEKYAPPATVVVVSVIEGDDGTPWVFLNVDKYEEKTDSRVHTTIAHVPPLRLDDLLRAFAACGAFKA